MKFTDFLNEAKARTPKIYAGKVLNVSVTEHVKNDAFIADVQLDPHLMDNVDHNGESINPNKFVAIVLKDVASKVDGIKLIDTTLGMSSAVVEVEYVKKSALIKFLKGAVAEFGKRGSVEVELFAKLLNKEEEYVRYTESLTVSTFKSYKFEK